jgi:hypothetical protein
MVHYYGNTVSYGAGAQQAMGRVLEHGAVVARPSPRITAPDSLARVLIQTEQSRLLGAVDEVLLSHGQIHAIAFASRSGNGEVV